MPMYLVKFDTPNGGPVEKLVEANNKAVARNWVARNMISAELAESTDIVRIVKAGGEVEVAKELPEAAQASE